MRPARRLRSTKLVLQSSIAKDGAKNGQLYGGKFALNFNVEVRKKPADVQNILCKLLKGLKTSKVLLIGDLIDLFIFRIL